MKDLDYASILNLEVEISDSPNTTIRCYLKKILSMVWEEKECFNGKRPFGNSGWEMDLYIPLVKAGFVEGTFDDEGIIEEFDEDLAKKIIFDLIDYIFKR